MSAVDDARGEADRALDRAAVARLRLAREQADQQRARDDRATERLRTGRRPRPGQTNPLTGRVAPMKLTPEVRERLDDERRAREAAEAGPTSTDLLAGLVAQARALLEDHGVDGVSEAARVIDAVTAGLADAPDRSAPDVEPSRFAPHPAASTPQLASVARIVERRMWGRR